MENDISLQLKNTIDHINKLQYLISITSCINERYYYYDLLNYYYYIYQRLLEIRNIESINYEK